MNDNKKVTYLNIYLLHLTEQELLTQIIHNLFVRTATDKRRSQTAENKRLQRFVYALCMQRSHTNLYAHFVIRSHRALHKN